MDDIMETKLILILFILNLCNHNAVLYFSSVSNENVISLSFIVSILYCGKNVNFACYYSLGGNS